MKNILLMSCGKSNFFVKSFYDYIKKNNLNYNLIGIDGNIKSNFFRYLKYSILSPSVKSKSFKKFFFTLIKKFQIDYIIPFNDFDLKFIKSNYKKIKIYSKIMSPKKNLLDYGFDKVKTKILLKKLSLFSPKLFKSSQIRESDFPLVYKGRGKHLISTKGLSLIKNYKSFLKIKSDKNFIFEQEIKGVEYTVDVISNYKKKFTLVLPRQRIKTKNFVSIKAKIDLNSRIIKQAKIISSFFNFIGLANFQCIVDDKKKNIYWTDLNLRISGGIDFALQSIPNFFEILINSIENKKINNISKIKLNKKILYSKNIHYLCTEKNF